MTTTPAPADKAGPAAKVTVLEVSLTDSGTCAVCGAEAMFEDARGKRKLCMSCLHKPAPKYGAGYQWQGTPISSTIPSGACRKTQAGYICTLSPGHDLLHEAWDNRSCRLAWDADQVWYSAGTWKTARSKPAFWQGSPCKSSATPTCSNYSHSVGYYCTLPPGHDSWHEMWVSSGSQPQYAWSPDGQHTWRRP
jgi:hypothetical protein